MNIMYKCVDISSQPGEFLTKYELVYTINKEGCNFKLKFYNIKIQIQYTQWFYTDICTYRNDSYLTN